MSYLTNILYWISTSLLIPVIVILLIALVTALLMLGGFYGGYMNRLKFKKKVKTVLAGLRAETTPPETDFSGITENKGLFSEYLKMLVAVERHPVHAEKIVADFELAGERELEAPKVLMRIGPMLGLMGTLIPMGPALVGLAAGDIASMAINMQVAFSTTVVGIFVGAIGYVTQLVKQRWHIEDVNNLKYIHEWIRTEAGRS
jgi:biopolymer transport protein ExbB/TolQ